MLDRPLALEHRRRDLDVMAAIARDQRQVSPADPDDRADRISDREYREPAPPVPAEPGADQQAEDQQPEQTARCHADEDELRRAGGSRARSGNLVELMGDGVEGRRDPAIPEVEPGGGERPQRRDQGKGNPIAAYRPPSDRTRARTAGSLVMASPP